MATKTREDQIVTLTDGRRLAYAEYGDPDGPPVVYLHGTPGSRLTGRRLEDPALQHGVRVIAFDRPGYGLSDFDGGPGLVERADDVFELADFLQLQRFAVWGSSGGAPYALACGWRNPDRISSVVLESGLGPFPLLGPEDEIKLLNKVGTAFAARAPFWLSKLLADLVSAGVRRFPDAFYSIYASSSAKSDRERLNQPEVKRRALATSLEPFRSGGAGWASDEMLLALPWRFRLEEVNNKVHLYHGQDDLDVPASMAKRMEESLPYCRATYYTGVGHQFDESRVSQMFGDVFSQTDGRK